MGAGRNLFGKEPGKKEQEAFKELVKNADAGDGDAKERLRQMIKSDETRQGERLARTRIEIYAQAAYQGDLQAQYWLGISYARLLDKEASLEWLTGPAKKGHVKAMKAIAKGYGPKGVYGYRKDEQRFWILKAAEAGDARSQADMGWYYAARNERISRQWFKKSALQDCPAGWLGLGQSFYNEALQDYERQDIARREKQLLRAEKCFLEALACTQKASESADICHALGMLYESALDKEGCAQRAAYFYYRAFRKGGKQEDFAAFMRVRDKNGLVTKESDIQAWEEEIFGNGKAEEKAKK